MSFLAKIFKTRETQKKELRASLGLLMSKHLKLLAAYTNSLESIFYEYNESKQKIAGSVSGSLLIRQIEKLDDDFEKGERELFQEYRKICLQHKRLTLIEKKEQFELALADIKNKINVAVVHVSTTAKSILPTANEINLSGSPKARLEYLVELTLQKQLDVFNEIINQILVLNNKEM